MTGPQNPQQPHNPQDPNQPWQQGQPQRSGAQGEAFPVQPESGNSGAGILAKIGIPLLLMILGFGAVAWNFLSYQNLEDGVDLSEGKTYYLAFDEAGATGCQLDDSFAQLQPSDLEDVTDNGEMMTVSAKFLPSRYIAGKITPSQEVTDLTMSCTTGNAYITTQGKTMGMVLTWGGGIVGVAGLAGLIGGAVSASKKN